MLGTTLSKGRGADWRERGPDSEGGDADGDGDPHGEENHTARGSNQVSGIDEPHDNFQHYSTLQSKSLVANSLQVLQYM